MVTWSRCAVYFVGICILWCNAPHSEWFEVGGETPPLANLVNRERHVRDGLSRRRPSRLAAYRLETGTWIKKRAAYCEGENGMDSAERRS